MIYFYFNIRFELKKISELTEEELRENDDDDDSEPDFCDQAPQDQDEVENVEQSDEKLQHKGTARSITAAKILKADLAC